LRNEKLPVPPVKVWVSLLMVEPLDDNTAVAVTASVYRVQAESRQALTETGTGEHVSPDDGAMISK